MVWFSATGAIADQTQATLPLASGTAVDSLPPEPGRFRKMSGHCSSPRSTGNHPITEARAP